MATEQNLPVGKLPSALLAALLADAPQDDPDLILGPGIGLDCAVVRVGERFLVFKADPITFASDELGWYLVQVNANDVATAGATPRWLLVTLLLPEGKTSTTLVQELMAGIYGACRALGIAVIGGHTEVTYGLTRPLALGTMVGEVQPQALVTPQGARVGDVLLLTKGVPIEGTAILARELPDRLQPSMSAAEIERAAAFLYQPGISVVSDAQAALAAGEVTAMHDPTEGGVAAALWELAEASGRALEVDPEAIPVPPLSARICSQLALDPLATIASGALLLVVTPAASEAIQTALVSQGIACAQIGKVVGGAPAVYMPDGRYTLWHRPERDEIARAFEG